VWDKSAVEKKEFLLSMPEDKFETKPFVKVDVR